MDFRASILPLYYVCKLMGLVPFSYSNKVSVRTKQKNSTKDLLSPNVLWTFLVFLIQLTGFMSLVIYNVLDYYRKKHFICHNTRHLINTANVQHMFCFPNPSCVHQKEDGISNDELYCYRSNFLTGKLWSCLQENATNFSVRYLIHFSFPYWTVFLWSVRVDR